MIDTITVVCGMHSGVSLRTFRPVHVDGGTQFIPDRASIDLHYGNNPGIDAEQFEAWREASKDEDIVLSGLVFAMPEVPDEAMNPLEPELAEPTPKPELVAEPLLIAGPEPDEASREDGVQFRVTDTEEHS